MGSAGGIAVGRVLVVRGDALRWADWGAMGVGAKTKGARSVRGMRSEEDDGVGDFLRIAYPPRPQEPQDKGRPNRGLRCLHCCPTPQLHGE